MSEEKSDKWVMPEPIFRRSTGELVKPSENALLIDPEPDTLEPVNSDEETDAAPAPESAAQANVSEAVPESSGDPLADLYAPPEGHVERAKPREPAAPEIEIEPQPFISEEFTAEAVIVETVRAKPKGSMRPVFFVTGIIALLGVAAGFVWLVIYLFFSARPDSSGF